jgi:hypothetical protein
MSGFGDFASGSELLEIRQQILHNHPLLILIIGPPKRIDKVNDTGVAEKRRRSETHFKSIDPNPISS